MVVVAPKKNRLATETSPYLLQHAENPVDWYPWGPEALLRAQREDKPILLSVGYAACHWCHVMERECFENPAIAELMNRSFVCIKVDREERPDIDDVYMAATVAISGSGGWPMTVFCTPEQTPFFAGTYFPPQDRAGRPGFATLLQRIARLWETDRDSLFRQAGELCEHLEKQASLPPSRGISVASLELATGHLARTFDDKWGGFGKAPKFPACQALHLLLRQYSRTGNAQLLDMVTRTLDAMSRGGIYDHVGGGFARYSTDERWLVPHFEKMLYDNAQLVRVYLEAYQVTGFERFRVVVEETLDYVIREMQDGTGGYYSATDADSEGEEGKFFVFTPKQLRDVLEPEEVRAFCAYYDISEAGNWEGKSIPNTPKTLEAVAQELKLEPDELGMLVRTAKTKVFTLRALRTKPLTDDKIIAAWNGLMIGSMAEAGRVLGESKYIDSARRAAGYLSEHMRTKSGGLLRIARKGAVHTWAVLEDYAYVADALVDLYEATGETTWLRESKRLAAFAVSDFLDTETGAFFQTGHDHEPLIVRMRDGNDGAMPNAGAVMARALLRLGDHFQDEQFSAVAADSLRAYGASIGKRPHAHLTTLNVLEWLFSGSVQLGFAGTKAERAPFERAAARVFLPQRTITFSTASDGFPDGPSVARVASAHGAKPALYICRDYVCLAPVSDASNVERELKAALDASYAQRVQALALPLTVGHATAAGTQRYLDRHRVAEGCVRSLGRQPVWVSAVGFGTHRVFESLPEHQEALLLALRKGCNLVDTAFSYAGGESERAVGNVIHELIRAGELRRDEVVVMTKVASGIDVPLQTQLETSLERLGLSCVDVCFVHNPEELYTKRSKEEASHILKETFVWLESQVKAGKVGCIGVASNTLSREPKELTLEEVLSCARAAGADHFEVVQVPFNFLEVDETDAAWVELAVGSGLSVITHRPLNAIHNGEVERLFDAPTDTAAPALSSAREEVAALEHEFRAQLGAVLAAVPQIELRPEQLFTWSQRVAGSELKSREAWDEFERGTLAKELTSVVGAVDRAFEGKQLGQVWRSWRSRYTNAMTTLVAAARNVAAEATNQRNADVRSTLQTLVADEGFDANLAQMAVAFASAQPGVSSTLVGMRAPRYVLEMLALLRAS